MKRGLLAALLFGLVCSSSAFAAPVQRPCSAGIQQAQRDGTRVQGAGFGVDRQQASRATPGEQPQSAGAVIIWLQNWMNSHLSN